MKIERHRQKFTPHFEFRAPGGTPIWRQSPLEGFYAYNIGVKILNGKVYAVKVPGHDNTRITVIPEGIFKGLPLQVPEDHELLAVISVYSSPNELGVFHADDKSIFATFRELIDDGNQKTFKLGSFKRIKQFNTALALQQRTNSWLIIPPHHQGIVVRTFTDSKNDTQFKDHLRDKCILWKPNKGEPLFIYFHKRQQGVDMPPGVIITDDRKLYLFGLVPDTTKPPFVDNLPFVDLAPLTTDLSDEEFRKKFENPENFALAFTLTEEGHKHMAFQFGDKIYRVLYNKYHSEQTPKLVKETGHLINSENTILIQDGTMIKDPVSDTTMKIEADTKIVWAQKLLSQDPTVTLLSDDSAGFHLIIPGEDSKLTKSLRIALATTMVSPVTPLSKDTVFRLFNIAGSWLKTVGFCQ